MSVENKSRGVHALLSACSGESQEEGLVLF